MPSDNDGESYHSDEEAALPACRDDPDIIVDRALELKKSLLCKHINVSHFFLLYILTVYA